MANTVNLSFTVTKQAITRTDAEVVASGAINTLVANFDFCETWDGLTRFCRFEGAAGVVDVAIDDDDKCVIPWEVIEAPSFTMACYGTLSSDVQLTTTKLTVRVYQSVNFITEEPLPSTPKLIDIYSKLAQHDLSDLAFNSDVTEIADDLGEIADDLAGEASTRAAADTALGARIDNIIAPEGDPSLTELADVRTGYDGTTYPTAGAAVRGQVGDLKTFDSTAKDEGTNILVTPTIMPTDYRTVDYHQSSGVRTFAFEDDALHVRYQTESTSTGTLASHYTNAGLSDDDGIRLYFNDEDIDGDDVYACFSIESAVFPENAQNMWVQWNVKGMNTGTEDINADFLTTNVNERILINISEWLRNRRPSSNFDYVLFRGIVGGQGSLINGTYDLDVRFYGYYTKSQVDEGLNLAEKAEVLQTKADQIPLVDAKANRANAMVDALGARIDAFGESDTGCTDALLIRETLPSYYTDQPENPSSFNDDSYIDTKLDSIPNGKSFMFFTDTHWDETNARNSIKLVNYVRKRKGIRNVVFGGDFINRSDSKFVAKQIMSDFANKCRAAFGMDFLPVFGNHDQNLANAIGSKTESELAAMFLPYEQTQKTLFTHITDVAHTYWESKGEEVAALAEQDQLEELEAYCKMTYYYDDKASGIRYIVMNSAKPNYGVWYDIFGADSVRPWMQWLYETLLSTPTGYDVVFAIHMIHNPYSLAQTDQPLNIYSALLMGLKTRTNKKTYIQRNTDAEWAMYPYTVHEFDFTGANEVGRVFMIAGHAHTDNIEIVHQRADQYNGYLPEVYDGETVIDQTVNRTDYNGCDIPLIWTTTDAFRRYTDWPDASQQVPMEKDTVTEQAFDVFTMTDDGITITRFGAGSDRKVYMDW